MLGDRAATSEDVPKLCFAEAVVKETMRLYPPAWAIGREATVPLTVAGIAIEKGTQLWAAQSVVHRDPRWYSRIPTRSSRSAGSRTLHRQSTPTSHSAVALAFASVMHLR